MPAGRVGCESGVFWLGVRDRVSEVITVVFPVGDGVEETPFYWSVTPEVYAAVTALAKPQGLTLLAVVHTHLSAHTPEMTLTDRREGLKTPDALALIVPGGGDERDTARWGWFVYESGDYRPLAEDERAARIELTEGEATLAIVGKKR